MRKFEMFIIGLFLGWAATIIFLNGLGFLEREDLGFTKQHEPTFDDLLDAICQVESGGRADAVGDGGAAVGAYQIHQIYVDDVNRIMRIWSDKYQSYIDNGRLTKAVPVQIDNEDVYQFSYEDRRNEQKSRAMTSIYLNHYGTAERLGYEPTFEDYARIHNGGLYGWKKQSTEKYWLKVKERLKCVKR
ncbi:hypothetical protein LCGC14_0421100 [marine sediment metagenome]|uniref:Transglycosylase SLT domain-containing protein n=1 Tax=marine sediment metagenome TaxID=412755 RepID=A0A0F9W021_9ZZZZ